MTKTHSIRRRHSLLFSLMAIAMSSCGWVEDDLSDCKAAGLVEITLDLSQVQLDSVWDVNYSQWQKKWHYGWDAKDQELWGSIGYPIPESYQAMFMDMGTSLTDQQLQDSEQETEYKTTFYHTFPKGYNDFLVWSNVSNSQGVQTLEIDASDPLDVKATAASAGKENKSGSIVSYGPDAFCQATINDVLITGNTSDYDYYDSALNQWVKHVEAKLEPLVYIYLTQIIIYNNNSRLYNLNGDAVITNFAQAVCVNDRIPSHAFTAIAFPMRLKRDITIDGDKSKADIIGGKLTTFGLAPSQPQLRNKLSVNVGFSNQRDSTLTFDLTSQVQAQPHGGILTIEIDMDTIRSPAGSSGGSTFDPWVKEYSDSITYHFDI